MQEFPPISDPAAELPSETFGLDHFPVGLELRVLLVYGERAFRAACGGMLGLYKFTIVALPENCTAEEDAELAASLCKLAGCGVVIWPEGDDEAAMRAERHAALIAASGASAVGVATLPDGWPPGFQIGDPLPAGVLPIGIGAVAEAALSAARARALPRSGDRPGLAVVPASNPPDAGSMFAGAVTLLARRLAEPQTTLDAIALWCLHAWTLRDDSSADISPRLILHANDARADHARALRLIGWLTPSPLLVSRTIAAHLLPAIEADGPTLLIDDIAGGMLYRRDIRTLIAAGALRDGTFLAARTKRNKAGRYSCFAPACIATAVSLPDDVRVRSIVVPMAPAPAGEARMAPNFGAVPDDVRALRAQMQAFAARSADTPFDVDAVLPRTFSAAARENWRPLIALALAIGARVASRARDAAVVLGRTAPPPASNLGLLHDIRELCAVEPKARIPSGDLLEKLTADPERPWATAFHGRKLTPRALAERLGHFGVRPAVLRTPNGALARGYQGEVLIDAFARYLGETEGSGGQRADGRDA